MRIVVELERPLWSNGLRALGLSGFKARPFIELYVCVLNIYIYEADRIENCPVDLGTS